MTQKRKADLQRKLSMAPVAKPPSDLLDRIKSDIPGHLDAAADRQRLSRSVAFSVRVAASILLLVSSVFLTMQIVSRHGSLPVATPMAEFEPRPKSPESESVALPPPAPDTGAAPSPAALRGTRLADTTFAIGEKKDAKAEQQQKSNVRQRIAPPQPRPSAPQVAEADSSVDERVTGGVIGGVVGGVEGGVVAEAMAPPAAAPPPPPPMEVVVTAAAPAVTDAVATQAAVTVQPSAARLETNVSRDQASFVETGKLATSSVARRRSALSKNPGEVGRLKRMLDRGETPKENIDVAAVVDHFAGSANNAAKVRLQVEASRAPLASSGTAVIRYTIDTPRKGVTHADLTIALEKDVIASHRTIGRVLPVEGTLGGQSVTGLVELRLAPDTRPDDRVATIMLRYSTGDQPEERAAQEIFARDLSRGWEQSSRRHKLATLGAVWAESLGKTQRPSDLERAAKELAEDMPSDPLAQELVGAIASSRPRSSGPTGSGR